MLLIVGWYRVLLVMGWYTVALWAGTMWHCGLIQNFAGSELVQIIARSGMVQIGNVGWYRVFLGVGRHRVALWAGTEYF